MKRMLQIIVFGLGFSLCITSARAAHEETLAGTDNQLVGRDGREVNSEVIAKKAYLFIYFSAGWCPHCKKFTPQLADFYKKHYQNGNFEVLFVSSDKSPDEMRKYWATAGIPGVALKRECKRSDELTHQFGAVDGGIPCVVLLGPDGTLLASSFDDGKYLGPDAALKKYLELH
jgi:thiol-disulfide isomerase/thioredoxin